MPDFSSGVWTLVPSQLGRVGDVRDFLAVSRGQALADWCPQLLEDSQKSVLKFPDPHEIWRKNLPEVTRLFEVFFRGAPGSPGVLWNHSVYWTDRAVARGFCRADVQPNDVDFCDYHLGEPVPLYFDSGRTRMVWVNTGADAVRWLYPEGEAASRFKLVKVVQSRVTREGLLAKSGSHRETVGVAVDELADERWLLQGLFPGLEKRIFSIWRPDDGGALQVHPSHLGGGFAVAQAGTPGKVVDGVGVLNIFLLKAWRFSTSNLVPGVPFLMVDELSFGLDLSGKVAYISTQSDRFGHLDERLEETAIRLWLDRHMP
jgi:hypothetical protein